MGCYYWLTCDVFLHSGNGAVRLREICVYYFEFCWKILRIWNERFFFFLHVSPRNPGIRWKISRPFLKVFFSHQNFFAFLFTFWRRFKWTLPICIGLATLWFALQNKISARKYILRFVYMCTAKLVYICEYTMKVLSLHIECCAKGPR